VGTESLAQLSNNLVYSAIAVYTLAMVAYAAEAAFGRTPGGAGAQPVVERADRLGRVALSLSVLAVALHAAGALTRGLAAGRFPWGNMYEFSLTGSLAVAAVSVWVAHRHAVRFLGLVVVPAVLLTLGLAVTVLYTEAAELVPALQSVWFVVHVSSVIFAAAVFTAGAGVTVLYLLRARAERAAAERSERAQRAERALVGTGPGGSAAVPAGAGAVVAGWTARLPSAERLDRLAYRLHAFAFPLFTFAVVAGAIWAENAWGRYWGWDPKEIWAFITWVVYAAYLHARATAGWRGGRAAGIALVGCAALWFNYYGVNLWFSGLHSYAGVG
jgi:cytochrome c-type biogenesis protein CcsB